MPPPPQVSYAPQLQSMCHYIVTVLVVAIEKHFKNSKGTPSLFCSVQFSSVYKVTFHTSAYKAHGYLFLANYQEVQTQFLNSRLVRFPKSWFTRYM